MFQPVGERGAVGRQRVEQVAAHHRVVGAGQQHPRPGRGVVRGGDARHPFGGAASRHGIEPGDAAGAGDRDAGFQVLVVHAQPFTAPSVMPCITCRWATRNSERHRDGGHHGERHDALEVAAQFAVEVEQRHRQRPGVGIGRDHQHWEPLRPVQEEGDDRHSGHHRAGHRQHHAEQDGRLGGAVDGGGLDHFGGQGGEELLEEEELDRPEGEEQHDAAVAAEQAELVDHDVDRDDQQHVGVHHGHQEAVAQQPEDDGARAAGDSVGAERGDQHGEQRRGAGDGQRVGQRTQQAEVAHLHDRQKAGGVEALRPQAERGAQHLGGGAEAGDQHPEIGVEEEQAGDGGGGGGEEALHARPLSPAA